MFFGLICCKIHWIMSFHWFLFKKLSNSRKLSIFGQKFEKFFIYFDFKFRSRNVPRPRFSMYIRFFDHFLHEKKKKKPKQTKKFIIFAPLGDVSLQHRNDTSLFFCIKTLIFILFIIISPGPDLVYRYHVFHLFSHEKTPKKQSSDIFAKDVSLHNLKSKSQVLVITEHRPFEKPSMCNDTSLRPKIW